MAGWLAGWLVGWLVGWLDGPLTPPPATHLLDASFSPFSMCLVFDGSLASTTWPTSRSSLGDPRVSDPLILSRNDGLVRFLDLSSGDTERSAAASAPALSSDSPPATAAAAAATVESATSVMWAAAVAASVAVAVSRSPPAPCGGAKLVFTRMAA